MSTTWFVSGIRTFVAALLLAAAAPALAHMASHGELQVIHPWADPGEIASMVHPTLVNDGASAIEIVDVSTSVARDVSFVVGGRDVAGVTLEPGATLTPDNLAIRLGGLSARLVIDDHFQMTLELAGGGRIDVHVMVGEMSTMMEMP